MGNEDNQNHSPLLRLAVLSMLMCGLLFPLSVTGLAQLFMPSQANGSIVQLNGRNVGSQLIAQNFSLPIFFQPRNNSASRVDPDITLQEAYSQMPRLHNATDISSRDLLDIVNSNSEGGVWVSGDAYVNVLLLNLILIQRYPQVYSRFQ